MTTSMVRNMRGRWLVGAVIATLLAVLSVPGRALAHAELLTTNPSAGQVLEVAPDQISLTFSEPVESSLGAVRLFDGRGDQVPIGAARHPGDSDTEVVVDVGDLPDGSYVVDWRVVSADSHPVQGAFTFQVGSASDLDPGTLTEIINREHTGRSASVGLGITRGLIIGAIAVVFGGLVAIGWGIVGSTRRLRVLIAGAAVVGAIAGVLQLPLEVAYATARPLSTVFESSAWSAALDSRIGVSWLVRAALIGVFGAALLILVADRAMAWWRTATIVGLVATGVASAYGGHGATGRWIPVGIAATTLHVAAMAVWLGGLLMLVVEFRSAGAATVRRFSGLAMAMIALVVASGVVQSIRQLGSFDALTDTTYGTQLIWKLFLVVFLLFVAAMSRRVVHRGELDLPRLGRAVTIESLLAVAIVGVTAVLMSSNPSQVIAAQPFSITLNQGDYLASITVEPGRVGPNEMHVYLSDAVSSLAQPDAVIVEVSDPARDVAAIQVPVERSGAGHFTTSAATFPYAATWTVIVTARYGFDEVQFTARVPVR